jgi:acyl-CoA thioesterase
VIPSDSTARALAEAATARMLEADEASRAMGMNLVTVDRDHAVFDMRVREDMLNGLNTCHGGIVFSLADTVCAMVANSRNQKSVLQSATVTLTAPVHKDDILTATGHRSAGEGRVAVIDVTVTNQKDETVALFRGSTYEIRGTHVDQAGD